jgi:carboxyl-terminal processing protease
MLTVWRVDPAGPAASAGIRPGWIVESIGRYRPDQAHARVAGIESVAAQRALTQFLFAANVQTEGPAGSVVELQLRDGADRPVTRTVRRRERPGAVVRFGHLPAFIAHLEHERRDGPDGCVGVIRFNVWMVPLRAPFDNAVDELRDCRGIVLDLRGNPGGIAGMVMGVAGHFLDQPESLGTMRSRGSELHFRANPRRVNGAAQPVRPFDGPVAILVDGMSVSTSEIFAGGMQAIGRARVFGQTTSGQALPAALLRLPDGDLLMHVVADFTDASGTRIEGRGVVPDQQVEVKRADLLAGRDAVIDAAITWIRTH